MGEVSKFLRQIHTQCFGYPVSENSKIENQTPTKDFSTRHYPIAGLTTISFSNFYDDA